MNILGNHQMNNPENFQGKNQKIVTKKLDKSKSGYYKRYRKVFTVIVSAIIVFLVFNLFFQMANPLSAFGVDVVKQIESQEILKALQDANALPTNEFRMETDVVTDRVNRLTKEGGIYVGGFENDAELPKTENLDSPKSGEPTPKTEPQKKVYKYFWNKNKWTYAAMNALKPLEIKSYLAKAGVDVTVRADFMDAYSYFKDLKVAKHGQETVEGFESRLTSK